jgi:hypothetical protein
VLELLAGVVEVDPPLAVVMEVEPLLQHLLELLAAVVEVDPLLAMGVRMEPLLRHLLEVVRLLQVWGLVLLGPVEVVRLVPNSPPGESGLCRITATIV